MQDRGKPVPDGTDTTLMVHTGDGLRPVADLGTDPPPEPEKEADPDPEPEPKETKMPEPKKPEPKKPTKVAPKPGKRAASEEAVLTRAKRMYRSKLRQVWEALGKEGPLDEEALEAELSEMAKNREAQMGEKERVESRLAKLEEQNAELRTRVSAEQAKVEKASRTLAAEQQRRENLEIEYEIREIARNVGISDGEYALHLFRSHVRTLDETEDPDPHAYFEGLKRDDSKRHLFREEAVRAGPPTLETDKPPTPPGQGANPQPQPTPTPAGPPKMEDDALAMDRRTFNARTAEKYGFRPGMS